MARLAVVLFNLGGPDSLAAVRPFLFNLFNDRAIIGLPAPLRWLLAQVISRRRASVARDIYARIGGRSPLLDMTEAQARALETALGDDIRVFVAMRYWHPMSGETALRVRDYRPDRVVLLPLYPQFSTTTTASSIAEWQRVARAVGLVAETATICCYPTQAGLVAATAEGLRGGLAEAASTGAPRVLFSAHGLPRKVIAAGDPYQWQVECTAAAVARAAGLADDAWVVCYQSRVGPLEWIGPSTEEEIRRAGRDGVPVVVVPIAFVSEHSETLVELDIEYRHLADQAGVPAYIRVATVGTAPAFIVGLADLVRASVAADGLRSQTGVRNCPVDFTGCPLGGKPR